MYASAPCKRAYGRSGVFSCGMQSGVTNNLINELRLHLGVARRTLQRWRHWVARNIRGNPILGFRQRLFYAANRASLLAKELIGSFQREGCPIAVGAVPAISGTTFKARRDHLR